MTLNIFILERGEDNISQKKKRLFLIIKNETLRQWQIVKLS